MTGTKINSFKKGTRCRICTGCGRCFSQKKMTVVNHFFEDNGNSSRRAEGTEREEIPTLMQRQESGCLITADIGTTTVAMQLRRETDGMVIDSFTAENPQREYGSDVLSRIEAAENEQIKLVMQESVKEVLFKGVRQFLTFLQKKQGGQKDNLKTGLPSCRLVIAANTTMVHLLLGLDMSRLGRYPFIPESLSEIRTELFDMQTLILPGISAFVGGDITAGITALSLHESRETALLLDLGTNGEMVLGNAHRLLATAAAAGPAFESGTGGYGTDMLALTDRLLQEGILDETGLLEEPYFEQGIRIGGVLVTQSYIRQLQTAKAAICTGIRILCKKYGLESFKQIDKVYLAGGMGYFLSPKAAENIGLLPKTLAKKAVAVGNAALEGAFIYGRNAYRKDKGLSCEVFNLAEEPEFSESYISNMFLKPCEEEI